MKRRRFLRSLLVGGLAVFAAPFVYAADKFLSYQGVLGGSPISKIPAAQLTEANPSTLVEIEGEPVIVVREPTGTIRAFTATCTHLGCIVNYVPQMPIEGALEPGFYCRCHGGKFNENGINVPGTPPDAPLTELTVSAEGSTLVISSSPKTSRT